MWKLHEYRSQSALLEDLTLRLSQTISTRVADTGKVSVALSGGSTPTVLYQQLSQLDLPWHAVTVSLVDERWVDDIHMASNARFIRHTLIRNCARRASFVGMKTSHTDAFAAADSISRIITRHVLPLDLVLLGMGLDGHTASLFPGAIGLAPALSPDCRQVCCAIQPLPTVQNTAPVARMTLSLNTILSAQQRILYISGAAKRQVLEQAFAEGPITDMPIRAVLHDSQTLTEIYYAPED